VEAKDIMLLQQIVNGIVLGGIYSLTALGATMVYGIMRILDINNAGAYAIGAYVGYYIYSSTESLLLAIILGMLITGIFGIIIQRLIYLPLMDKSPNIALIASIGLFIVVGDSLRLIAGARLKAFHVGLPFQSLEYLGINISAAWILILLTTVVFLCLLWFILVKTKIGLAWKATSQDIEIASTMGVNPRVIIGFNYLLGYGFAAAAGIMVGIMYASIYPHMGDIPAYKMLSIIVLGGLGSPFGAVIAAMTIGMLETLVGGYIGFFLPRDAIAFIALVVILLVKPTGLIREK
jgi:branched-chain amino acid transport system permease protein